MRLYDVRDESGRLLSFEFDNRTWLQTRGTRHLVSSLQGGRLLQVSQAERLDGEFCRFEVEGCRFVVVEPFGDNSRILVSPLDEESQQGIESVRAAFAKHHPAIWFQAATGLCVASLLGGLAVGLVKPGLLGGIGMTLLRAGAIGLILLFLIGVVGLAGRSEVSLFARRRQSNS